MAISIIARTVPENIKQVAKSTTWLILASKLLLELSKSFGAFGRPIVPVKHPQCIFQYTCIVCLRTAASNGNAGREITHISGLSLLID
jgi:hypothetical protein